jgi:hypothetical protein
MIRNFLTFRGSTEEADDFLKAIGDSSAILDFATVVPLQEGRSSPYDKLIAWATDSNAENVSLQRSEDGLRLSFDTRFPAWGIGSALRTEFQQLNWIFFDDDAPELQRNLFEEIQQKLNEYEMKYERRSFWQRLKRFFSFN